MLHTRLDPTTTRPVDMDGVDGVSMRVLLGADHGMKNFSMRHFVVEPGGHTPRHAHDYEHEVLVLKGHGEAEHDGETINISAGDVLFVESDKTHQFRNTSQETLEFLCLVPRTREGGGEVPGS